MKLSLTLLRDEEIVEFPHITFERPFALCYVWPPNACSQALVSMVLARLGDGLSPIPLGVYQASFRHVRRIGSQ